MRWIRIDLSWSSSEWIAALEPESRLAWIEFLCYVKAFGRAGAVRTIATSRAAAMLNVSQKAFKCMLDAALTHGAVTHEDGEWRVTKWAQYQMDETATERKQAQRDRNKSQSVTAVTRDGCDVTNVTDVTSTLTLTETLHRHDVDVIAPPTEKEVQEYATSIGKLIDADRFIEHYSATGWKTKDGTPLKNWNTAVRNWIKRNETRNGKPSDIPPKREPGYSSLTPEEIEAIKR